MKFEFDTMYCGHVKRGDIMVSHENNVETVIVVVSENILNERLSTVLGVPLEIHKTGKTVYKNEMLLAKNETSLGKPAVCLVPRMRPFDRRHLVAKKGELERERLKELYKIIDVNLGRFRDK